MREVRDLKPFAHFPSNKVPTGLDLAGGENPKNTFFVIEFFGFKVILIQIRYLGIEV